jgi:hypothetical protein
MERVGKAAGDVLAAAGRREITRDAKYRALIREIWRLPLRSTGAAPDVEPAFRDELGSWVAAILPPLLRTAFCAHSGVSE